MRRFSEEHQWVDVRAGVATVGITAYAAEEMGEINFVELPDEGLVVGQGEALCVIESVKAASDVFSPVSGTVAKVNRRLEDDPTLLSLSPEKDGWICRLEDVDEEELDNLMTESRYEAFLDSGEDD